MAQLFPKWTNKLTKQIQLLSILGLTAVVFFFWYFGSPKYLEVGYAPVQPIPFSHQLHAGQLGIDCRYCHGSVEISPAAGIPSTQTCMTCHEYIATDSEKLQPLRDSWESGLPVEWIRIHKLPEHSYFNHSIHVNVGIGCATCHGRVDRMEVVMKTQPMSMGWCLDCHNNPEQYIRPVEEVFNMAYQQPPNQYEFGKMLVAQKNVSGPIYCNACHR